MEVQYHTLATYLRGFSGPNSPSEEEIAEHFQKVKFPKNTLLVEKNDVCDNLYFIISGSCRCYHIKRRRQVTHWFAFENSFITGFQSFTTRKPSPEYLQLMEDSLLLKISYQELIMLYARSPKWQITGRLAVEDYARQLASRITAFQTLNATQRYIQLFKTEPRILQRVPVIHIASI